MNSKIIKIITVTLLLPAMLLCCVSAAADGPEQKGGSEQAEEAPEPDPDPAQPAGEKEVVVTEYKSEESERFLWECLNEYAPSEAIAAGILGMFLRESKYRSDATAHWPTVLKYSGYDQAADFTAMIDAGLADGSTRELFIEKIHYAIGGYGLGQWYGYYLLEDFYDFAQEWGTTIADAEMQCAFAVDSLRNLDELWAELIEMEDPVEAGLYIGRYYDGSVNGYGYIGQLAGELYEKYAGEQAKAEAAEAAEDSSPNMAAEDAA
ncbi:MAG: hypothetical protein IJ594_07850 [Oscillospiraceae bacterium]|nr:hypothetical protein [Oscillospiraceae bacterium]